MHKAQQSMVILMKIFVVFVGTLEKGNEVEPTNKNKKLVEIPRIPNSQPKSFNNVYRYDSKLS